MNKADHYHIKFGSNPWLTPVDVIIMNEAESITHYMDFINNMFKDDMKDMNPLRIESFMRDELQKTAGGVAVLTLHGFVTTWMPCEGCKKSSMN